MVLKGWKEKQSPGRVKADESPDGKGVILIWTASEDPVVEKNVERIRRSCFSVPNYLKKI